MEASSVRKKRKVWVILVPAIILLVLLCGTVVGFTVLGNNAEDKVQTQDLSESLGYTTAAKFDFNIGTGNLTVDRLTGGEQLLASGALEYFEKQGPPTRSPHSSNGQAAFKLNGIGAGQPWFHFPWSACNGATAWQIHLNPMVSSDITTHTGGGNIKVDLAGMTVTRVLADTGGGNIDMFLPEHAADLTITSKTGAGNVTVELGSGTTGSSVVNATSEAGRAVVRLPGGIAARIHAATGLGKATGDPRFNKVDKDMYQSPGFDGAASKVEIKIHSGAGEVIVITR